MDAETQALVRRLKDVYAALYAFITLDEQVEEWEKDEAMYGCLPDLYRRRTFAATKYVEFNGRKNPLLPHKEVTLEMIEYVVYLLELKMTVNVEGALDLLSYDCC